MRGQPLKSGPLYQRCRAPSYARSRQCKSQIVIQMSNPALLEKYLLHFEVKPLLNVSLSLRMFQLVNPQFNQNQFIFECGIFILLFFLLYQ